MVVTDREEIASRIRVMRLHGIDRDIWQRYTGKAASWRYDVVAPGYKYNLTDLAAAIGRVQLRRAQEFLRKRRAVAERYLAAFRDLDFLQLPVSAASHAWHLFIIRLLPDMLRIDRDRFIDELQARGIGISVHFIPLHTMSYYRDRYGFQSQDFPASWDSFQRCISLPISAALADGEVVRVIEAVAEIGAAHRR
jgi:dTDP-4-amino-4,6-dideoxygalactose transaminase